MDLPLDKWLKAILEVANATGKPHPFTRRLRKKLEQLIVGELPLRRLFKHPLPPLFVSLRANRLSVLTDLNPSSEAETEEFKREGSVAWMDAHHADELEGAIYALSVDPLGKRVRQCDHCGLFFSARRNHRRQHHFCSENHRRAFDHEHRDLKEQADYMREYRQIRKQRRRAQ